MNCWPNVSVSFCPRVRAIMSVPPPGLNGTIKRTGFVGHVVALAATATDAGMNIRHASAKRASALFSDFIESSPQIGDNLFYDHSNKLGGPGCFAGTPSASRRGFQIVSFRRNPSGYLSKFLAAALPPAR